MKNSFLYSFVFSLLFAFSACQSGATELAEESAGDQAEAAAKMPGEATALLGNEFVQVKKIVLQPGQKQDMHDGPARTIYSLTDYQINWVENDQDEGEKRWKQGDVHWHEAGTHAAENTGSTTAEFLVVARTDAELPECGDNSLDQDVQSVAPEKAEVLFENDYVKVTRVDLEAGESIPRHAGINRVVLSLSDYTITYTAEGEAEETNTFSTEDVHWHDACAHALSNSGSSTASFAVFAFKEGIAE